MIAATLSNPLCRPKAVVSAAAVLLSLMGAMPAQAALSFEFDYSGNAAGVGFLDGTTGAARQAALTNAGNLFSSMFGSFFSNSGTLSIDVTSIEDAGSGTLASAGSYLSSATGFGAGEVIRTKLVTGVDLNGPGVGAGSDGSVNVNFGWNWELDPNVPAVGPGAGESFDFYAAIFHELTHALGFSSSLNLDGSDPFGNGNNGGAGAWAMYDSFLVDASNAPLIDGGSFLTNQATYDAAKVSGVFFNGANAVAANGGPVALYAPAVYENGSSVSHLNKVDFPNDMMKHDRDFGPEARAYSAVEVAMLTDIGYTAVAAVPEPGTYLMMIAGLGGLAFMRRRKG